MPLVNKDRFRKARRDRNLSPTGLAAAAGVTEQTVQRAERGHHLNETTIIRLAQALSTKDAPVTASDLIVNPEE
jgi:DNA-binding XRE family transcriptional regulator